MRPASGRNFCGIDSHVYAHDHRVLLAFARGAHGHALEMRHVCWELPRKGAILADAALWRGCNNHGDRWRGHGDEKEH